MLSGATLGLTQEMKHYQSKGIFYNETFVEFMKSLYVIG